MQRGHTIARAFQGGHYGLGHATDEERALAFLNLKGDGRALDGDDFADELRHMCQRPACLKRTTSSLGLKDVDIQNNNAIQGKFRFVS